MREQAVVQKVGNRSGIGSGRRASTAQRPARRERGQNQSLAERMRAVVAYLPVVFKVIVAVVLGVTLFVGYRAAASASFFQVRNVEVRGAVRSSAEAIETLVRREVTKTGVWDADLNHLNATLKQVTWIRSAVVSRVLPDGIRVRIVERVPRAVVRTSSGRFQWIDEDAVFLAEMGPTDQVPAFFLRGLSEEETEEGRKQNVERVAKFLQLQRECEVAGITQRISEINLAELHDVRVQLAGNDSSIEVRLGSQASGERLADGLAVLDNHRSSPRGHLISYIDLGQRKGAAIGFASGPRLMATSDLDRANEDRSNPRNKSTREKGSNGNQPSTDQQKDKRAATR